MQTEAERKESKKRINRKYVQKNPRRKKVVAPLLNVRQDLFVREWLRDKNQTQAAIRAGYAPRRAKQAANLLMGQPHIKAYADKLLKAQQGRVEISSDRIVKELARVAFSDVRPLFDGDGNLRDVHGLKDDVAAAVAGVQTEEQSAKDGTKTGQVRKVRMWDKIKALELLGKHFKMFTDVVETRDGDFLRRMECARMRKMNAQKK